MKFSFDKLGVSRKRIALAKTALQENEVDAIIFFDGDSYGRKFANTVAFTALILFPDKAPIIIAHTIEKDHAESESELEIVEIKDTRELKDTISHLLPRKTEGLKTKVAVVPWKAKFEEVKTIQELGHEIVDGTEDIFSKCLKKPFMEEIDEIRRLSLICDEGLGAAYNIVETGRREYEVAAEVDYAVKKLGVTEFNFPTLVASGYRAAFPHGWTSPKEIKKGDVVIVDIGPLLNSYDGCVCRTFMTDGGWKSKIEVIREAIYNSLEIIRNQETTSAAQIDKIARETVRKGGYRNWPDMKTVWTGHPIGGFSSPMITPESEDEIEEGMVFTVEPGIYIKGKGGVRIEHHVLAKKYDYEILDKYPQS
jgi:Xaa-Pro aminopeptidase